MSAPVATTASSDGYTEFRVFQVTLGELEGRTRLRFPAALHKGDTLLVPEAAADRTPLENLNDIQWD